MGVKPVTGSQRSPALRMLEPIRRFRLQKWGFQLARRTLYERPGVNVLQSFPRAHKGKEKEERMAKKGTHERGYRMRPPHHPRPALPFLPAPSFLRPCGHTRMA